MKITINELKNLGTTISINNWLPKLINTDKKAIFTGFTSRELYLPVSEVRSILLECLEEQSKLDRDHFQDGLNIIIESIKDSSEDLKLIIEELDEGIIIP